MKRKQRILLNRVKSAIAKGRKKGLIPTTGTLYSDYYSPIDDHHYEYACAYGALAAGLGIDIKPDDSVHYTKSIVEKVNAKLGLEGYCAENFYPLIYMANDNFFLGSSRDEHVIKGLETKLETDPEYCS